MKYKKKYLELKNMSLDGGAMIRQALESGQVPEPEGVLQTTGNWADRGAAWISDQARDGALLNYLSQNPDFQGLMDEWQQMKETIDRLTSENEEFQQKIDEEERSIVQIIDELGTSMDADTATIADLKNFTEAKLEAVEQEKRELKDSLDDKSKEIEAKDQQIAELKGIIDTFREKLRKEELISQQQKLELDSVVALCTIRAQQILGYEQVIKDLKQTNVEKDETISQLERDVRSLKSAVLEQWNEYKRQKDELMLKAGGLLGEINELEQKSAKQGEDLELKDKVISQLEKLREDSSLKISEQEEQIRRLNNMVQTLSAKIVEQTKALDSKESELRELQERYETLEREERAGQTEIRKLQKDIGKLKRGKIASRETFEAKLYASEAESKIKIELMQEKLEQKTKELKGANRAIGEKDKKLKKEKAELEGKIRRLQDTQDQLKTQLEEESTSASQREDDLRAQLLRQEKEIREKQAKLTRSMGETATKIRENEDTRKQLKKKG